MGRARTSKKVAVRAHSELRIELSLQQHGYFSLKISSTHPKEVTKIEARKICRL